MAEAFGRKMLKTLRRNVQKHLKDVGLICSKVLIKILLYLSFVPESNKSIESFEVECDSCLNY
jgi:hypothetical protein